MSNATSVPGRKCGCEAAWGCLYIGSDSQGVGHVALVDERWNLTGLKVFWVQLTVNQTRLHNGVAVIHAAWLFDLQLGSFLPALDDIKLVEVRLAHHLGSELAQSPFFICAHIANFCGSGWLLLDNAIFQEVRVQCQE